MSKHKASAVLFHQVLMGLTRILLVQEKILTNLRMIGARMATQDDVDQLVERINTVASTVDTGVSNIRQDIEEIKAANPAVDFSSLEESVANLEASAGLVTGLDEENPAAPVEPEEPSEPTDPEVPAEPAEPTNPDGSPIGQL